MKKKLLITLSVISVFLLSLIYVLLVGGIVVSQADGEEVLLESSSSPDGNYQLEAYRVERGATIDFSVKVYLLEKSRKKLIYNGYHESDARMEWENDTTVLINGKSLDLRQGDTYDWREDSY